MNRPVQVTAGEPAMVGPVVGPMVGPMVESAAVAALAALAQPMRLRVFRALVGAGPAGLTPGVLSAMLGAPPSTLSFHLKELARSGLVAQAREGRHLRYRPALDRMQALIGYLTDHCCDAGDAEGCAMATGAQRSDASSSPIRFIEKA